MLSIYNEAALTLGLALIPYTCGYRSIVAHCLTGSSGARTTRRKTCSRSHTRDSPEKLKRIAPVVTRQNNQSGLLRVRRAHIRHQQSDKRATRLQAYTGRACDDGTGRER